MPLYGLNGFMLGRASAAIRTEKLREPAVNPPVQMHLCSAKYPGSKSRFNSYVPEQSLSSFLYNPGSIPTWTADAAEELALQSSEDNETKRSEVAELELPRFVEGSSSGSSTEQSTRRLFWLDSSANVSALDKRIQPIAGRRRSYPGGRLRIRMTREASAALSSPILSGAKQRIKSLAAKEGPELDPGLLSLASGDPLIRRVLSTTSSSRRVKSAGARRRRNHIRENMEKETVQNTWRLRKLLNGNYEDHSSGDSPGIKDALQSFGGSWKDLYRKFLAEISASSRSPSKSRISPLVPAVPYSSVTSQPVQGKLVGKVQSRPTLQW
ncbi:hypothetical protein R1sor_004812 [Riccia sorocarpa]|uniref:Uncharacterized protein n=1 Tax=Riccia sorocarpa TaxID=122646 RepID=A0ABD3HJY9_9MARC